MLKIEWSSFFRMMVATWAALLVHLSTAISAEAGEDAVQASRIIQYRGPMPMLDQKYWGGEVKLKFELYRSPDGGFPFWKETRVVKVREDGWVHVDLGTSVPLPDEAFSTAFRFLSISQNQLDFGPRKQVASLAYVASRHENYLEPDDHRKYAAKAMEEAVASAAKSGRKEGHLDRLVKTGEVLMEAHPRFPTNWLNAVKFAGKMGARLPTFEEWYSAYDHDKGKELNGMEGHYEWVIPWVYEPSIHARLHELYRGKPVACYYEELSPMNNYPFRLVVENEDRAEKKVTR